MFQLSTSSLRNLLEKANELREKRPSGGSFTAFLQEELMQHFPELSVVEADQIIANLQAGIHDFNSKYHLVKQNDKAVDLLPLLEGMSTEDKFNALVNLQTVLQAYILDSPVQDQAQLDAIRARIVGQREPNEDSIAELQQELSSKFMQVQLDTLGEDPIRAILASSELTAQQVLNILCDESNVHYAALAAYICRREGDEALQDAPADPRLMAIAIAAGFAQTTNDLLLATDQITRSQWEIYTKRVLGTLLFLVLLLAGLLADVVIGLSIAGLVVSVIGTNVFSVVLVLGLAPFLGEYLSKKDIDVIFFLMAIVDECYERVVAWLQSKFSSRQQGPTNITDNSTSVHDCAETETFTAIDEATSVSEQTGGRNLQTAN